MVDKMGANELLDNDESKSESAATVHMLIIPYPNASKNRQRTSLSLKIFTDPNITIKSPFPKINKPAPRLNTEKMTMNTNV